MDDKENPELDYYLNQEYSDVVFVVDGQRLPAYKPILILKSRVFRAQFSGKFADSQQKEITITDATADGFKVMLRFLYNEELVFETVSTMGLPSIELVLDVYNLSQKYQLSRFAKCIEEYVDKILINYQNFFDLCERASERRFDRIVDITKKFMAGHIGTWLNRDIDKLKKLDDKTNNGLFEIILTKYREIYQKRNSSINLMNMNLDKI